MPNEVFGMNSKSTRSSVANFFVSVAKMSFSLTSAYRPYRTSTSTDTSPEQ